MERAMYRWTNNIRSSVSKLFTPGIAFSRFHCQQFSKNCKNIRDVLVILLLMWYFINNITRVKKAFKCGWDTLRVAFKTMV